MPSFQGDLADHPVTELVQFFHQGRKHGQLVVERIDHQQLAAIFFDQGQIVHAFCQQRSGEDALYRLFNWNEGRFVFLRQSRPHVRSITSSVQNLLLEGLRRMDEGGDDDQLADSLPPPTTVLHVERDADLVGEVRLTQAEWRLLSLVNGRRSLQEILELSPLPVVETGSMIHGLMLAHVLSDQCDDRFLASIVMERVPAEDAPRNRHPPPSILSNLLIRAMDGSSNLRVIRDAMTCSLSDLCEEVRLLVRTGWLRPRTGQDVLSRYIM